MGLIVKIQIIEFDDDTRETFNEVQVEVEHDNPTWMDIVPTFESALFGAGYRPAIGLNFVEPILPEESDHPCLCL